MIAEDDTLTSPLSIAERFRSREASVRINSLYSVAAPDSLPARLGVYQRRRVFARFLSASGVRPDDTIIDVGATGDRAYAHSNYLEAWYPYKRQLTAVGIDDASFLEELYPGVTFRQADGRALPFPNCSFDFAHSSAVIEHVGSRPNQVQFLAEMWRVCRKGVFVTTPNRWFPVELHSILPLIHWLPAPLFRRTLQVLGHHELADEANLNLMSRRDLLRAASAAGISGARVEKARFAGWTGNLLLIAHKPEFTAASHPMK
jgi:ubiquinone/menaquinone biosynthesis C-methylase UbiE